MQKIQNNRFLQLRIINRKNIFFLFIIHFVHFHIIIHSVYYSFFLHKKNYCNL